MIQISDPDEENRSLQPLKDENKHEDTIRSTLKLSFAFFCIFLSFSSAQNFQTSLNREEGSIALGIVYGTFCIGNVLSPTIIRRIGLLYSFALGGSAYILFVIHNSFSFPSTLIYCIAGVTGLGASIIWTAQGTFISRLSGPIHSTGSLSGIFFSIYQLNQFIGNILVALLFQFEVDTRIIFIIASLICFCGVMLFFSIRKYPKHEDIQHVSEISYLLSDRGRNKSVDTSVWSALKLLNDTRMRFMIIIIIFNGISESFIFGTFPTLVSENNIKFYVMAVFGLVNGVSSFVFGYLIDRIGKRVIILLGFLVSFSFYLWFALFTSRVNVFVYFFLACVLGIIDAIWITQSFTILSDFYKHDPETAFAVLKMVQSGATSISFIYSSMISVSFQSWLCTVVLCLGCTSLYIMDRFVAPL